MEEALRRANSAKDELLGMVSHEFRTPLATIVGNIDMLERSDIESESRQAALRDVRESGARLRRLVENMLVLASESPTSAEQEPILLHRVLPKIVASEQRLDERHPIELYVPEMLPPVLGNEAFVEQVLANLFSNARKYGLADSPIEVSVVHEADSGVIVRVCNRGELLSEEATAHFFEAFYRDQRTSTRVDGVGLGLSVCQLLVQSMGGQITASPHPDGGAIFEFTLPVASLEIGE